MKEEKKVFDEMGEHERLIALYHYKEDAKMYKKQDEHGFSDEADEGMPYYLALEYAEGQVLLKLVMELH